MAGQTTKDGNGARAPGQAPRLPLTLKDSGERAEGKVRTPVPTPLTVPITTRERGKKAEPDGHDSSAAIPVAGIRSRLCNLMDHLPGRADAIYGFGALLSERLGEADITPHGFVLATEFLLEDLSTGRDGRTGEPMPARFEGYPPAVFNVVVPSIINAACPPDFAERAIRIKQKLAAGKEE